MTNETIHNGDYGTLITIAVFENGVIKDISDATVIQFVFEDPSGNSATKTGAFSTDGTDGLVKYTLQSGDIDEAGVWKVQTVLTFPSGKWYSDVLDLLVEASV